jgi:hypothetical protein
LRSVAFLHPGTPEMASFRYRTLIPAEQLKAKVNMTDADTVVIGKPVHLDLVRQLKSEGRKIVADFCDDHFSHPTMGDLYHETAKIADFCVCPTEEMRKRIPAQKVVVIPDPYEMEELEPHAFGENLLWFGHNAGLSAIGFKYANLTVVTGPNINEGMIRWSPESLKAEMLKANIAIFPTAKGHEYKSPNRLVNALRMGLFPVCDRHPSYEEFKKFIWMTEVPTGIKWAREFKRELNDLVKQGQNYIRDRYSPEAIGAQWKEVLEAL